MRNAHRMRRAVATACARHSQRTQGRACARSQRGQIWDRCVWCARERRRNIGWEGVGGYARDLDSIWTQSGRLLHRHSGCGLTAARRESRQSPCAARRAP
eukprot:5099239-Pleurochrysis_carterae.AAC.1